MLLFFKKCAMIARTILCNDKSSNVLAWMLPWWSSIERSDRVGFYGHSSRSQSYIDIHAQLLLGRPHQLVKRWDLVEH